MQISEICLIMQKCDPGRIAANRVMLCTRNAFMLENMRDIYVDDYIAILKRSGSAGIIKE